LDGLDAVSMKKSNVVKSLILDYAYCLNGISKFGGILYRDIHSFGKRRSKEMPLGKVKGNMYIGITIEPICDFDVIPVLQVIDKIKPEFVNIGADSKGNNLPEPSWEKVIELIEGIKELGIEVREKSNLDRLKGRNDVYKN